MSTITLENAFSTVVITSPVVQRFSCACDCGLLNGSGVTFRHTNLDQLPRTGINIGTGVTIRHTNLDRVPCTGHLQAAIDRPHLAGY
uniref:Uncharacterized protein n=1 Tax=Solanum tuberosum TaxID=4113 RepID=M1DNN7_SOLTU